MSDPARDLRYARWLLERAIPELGSTPNIQTGADCARALLAAIVSYAPDEPRLFAGGPAAVSEAEALTFEALIAANLSRVVRWHPDGLHEWSALEWAGAMAGEAGEACNAAKKLRRIDGNLKNINLEEGRSLTERAMAAKQIAKEVADTIIYGVLLVASVGEDLPSAIIEVFNKKSEEYGFPERLADPGVRPDAPEGK